MSQNIFYLEIDSTYRNRNDFPSYSDFQIPVNIENSPFINTREDSSFKTNPTAYPELLGTRGKNDLSMEIVDPISKEVPILYWQQGDFGNNIYGKGQWNAILGQSVAILKTTDTYTDILMGTPSDPIFPDGLWTHFSKVDNYYAGTTVLIIDVLANIVRYRKIIKSYYLGKSNIINSIYSISTAPTEHTYGCLRVTPPINFPIQSVSPITGSLNIFTTITQYLNVFPFGIYGNRTNLNVSDPFFLGIFTYIPNSDVLLNQSSFLNYSLMLDDLYPDKETFLKLPPIRDDTRTIAIDWNVTENYYVSRGGRIFQIACFLLFEKIDLFL